MSENLNNWTLPATTGGRDYEVTFLADGTAWRVTLQIRRDRATW